MHPPLLPDDETDRLRSLHALRILLSGCFRAADVVARLGGDEFVVLLTGADPNATEPFDRLARMAGESPCRVGDLLQWSYGRFAADGGCALAHLLAHADAEMYKQKQAKKAAG